MPNAQRLADDLRWLVGHGTHDVLPHWLATVGAASGPFATRVDRQWKLRPDQVATIVSQGRLVYDFAAGARLTGDSSYLEACRRGAEVLLDGFSDPDHGGWFYALDLGGEVVDDRKDAYGHAFVIFGLSHAHEVTGDGRFSDGASSAWQAVKDHLVDPAGGVVTHLSREFAGPTDGHRSQNPVMHLFEALLALWQAGGREEARADALALGRFVVEGLIERPGNPLPELYTPAWTPLPEPLGGRIDIGHQFEWAYLLSRAAEIGLPSDWLPYAEGLLDYAVAHGLHGRTGAIVSPVGLSGDGLPSSRRGWWEQCEAMRALANWAVVRDRIELAATFEGVLRYVQDSFVDPVYGGWYAALDDDSKGSEWKLDYHVVALCEEAARLLRHSQ